MRRVTRWALAVGAIAVLCLGGDVLYRAQATVGVNLDIAAQQSALKEAREAASAARARAEALQADADAATASADRYAAEAAVLRAQIDAAEADVRAAKARIALIAQQQTRRRSELAVKRAPMMRLIAALQSMARRPQILALTQPRHVRDMVHLRMVMGGVQPVIARRTQALRNEIDRARAFAAQEKLALTALTDSQSALTDRRKELAVLEAADRAEASRIDNDANLERERALGLGEKARDIVESLGTREDNAAVVDVLAALPGPNPRRDAPQSVAPRSVYRLPVAGTVVMGLGDESDVGYRARGLTLSAGAGDDVVAPAAGTVIYAGAYRSFGDIVIIDHGLGWTSLLTGLDGLTVEKGEAVPLGAEIGSASEAGQVGVELRRNGRPVDILALIG